LKDGKIEGCPPVRHVTRDHLMLSPKEIRNFLHNAQLALCDAVEDEAINKNLFQQKQGIVHLFHHSLLTPAEIALILVSAAWDIFEGKKNEPCEQSSGM
jgi:hypothetical protein